MYKNPMYSFKRIWRWYQKGPDVSLKSASPSRQCFRSCTCIWVLEVSNLPPFLRCSECLF